MWTPFLGVSLVFMLLYVWSREFPNAQINLYGLVQLKVCWLIYFCYHHCITIRLLYCNCITFLCGSNPAMLMLINIHFLQAFYFPWAMLALDVIFGSQILPDLLGIVAGHLYYFLTVLHPLSTGKNILKTPRWVYPSLCFHFEIPFPSLANKPLITKIKCKIQLMSHLVLAIKSIINLYTVYSLWGA